MTDETAHDGTSGDDTLTGGAGADTFVFDPNHGNDVVTDFTNGEDLIDLSEFSTISGFSDLTVTSDENGVTIDLTAHGGGTVLLQGFDIGDLDAEDFLFRDTQAEPVLDGGGTSGDEALWADDDGDRLDGGEGNDVLYGGAGNDWLVGGAGDDVLGGEAGDDIMLGWDGDDTLYGGAGDDWLVGGKGDDTLHGGDGDDMLDSGDGDNALHGEAGDDKLYDGDGDNTLYGGAGDDRF